VREVTLGDGTAVADIVVRTRRAPSREIVPCGGLRAPVLSTDGADLPAGPSSPGRVWSGTRALAGSRREGGARTVRVGVLDGRDELVLLWAGILAWWTGGSD